MNEYLKYLTHINLFQIPIVGLILTAFTLIFSIILFLALKKEERKIKVFFTILILWSFAVFLIFTIVDFNLKSQNGNFLVSTYSPNTTSTNSPSNNQISNNTEKNYDNSSNDSYNNSNDYDNIVIKQDISEEVDKDPIIKAIQFNEETKKVIKKILSDPNPDPENKEGVICDNEYSRCKYCSKEIIQAKTFRTFQTSFNTMFFNPLAELGMTFVSAFGEEDRLRKEVVTLCEEFKNGARYSCELDGNPQEFCSLKCKDEYNLFH